MKQTSIHMLCILLHIFIPHDLDVKYNTCDIVSSNALLWLVLLVHKISIDSELKINISPKYCLLNELCWNYY